MTPAQNIFGTQDEVASLDAEVVTLDADETAEDGLMITPTTFTITTITTTTISIFYHC